MRLTKIAVKNFRVLVKAELNVDEDITLNTYTHVKFDDAKAEFDRVMEA